MCHYSEAAVERAMKVQEVILRAAVRKITIQAAEISPLHQAGLMSLRPWCKPN
jgi:hypothetical protein